MAGEVIPEPISRFVAAQLGEEMDELCRYTETEVTRLWHLVDLRQIYGYKMFSGHRARELKAWLAGEVANATANHDLARQFVDECRRTRTVLSGISVVERLCAVALVATERWIDRPSWLGWMSL